MYERKSKMYSRNLTKFIEEYVDVPDDWKYKDGTIMEHLIPSCIDVIINGNVFTRDLVIKQAIKDYGIIIEDKYFSVPVL